MIYLFGEYELDTHLYALRHHGQPCKLEPQVFNVLAYLVDNRHRVVTKDELLAHVWPDQFVGDAVLTQRIMAVRKALGDSGRVQRSIQTLHGRGYRFIAEVIEQQVDLAPASSQPGSAFAASHTAPPSSAPESHDSVSDVTPARDWQRCPTCQQGNSVSAQFCIACGTRLVHICAHCGHQVHLPAMFCPTCGQRVLAAVPEPQVSLPRTPAVLEPLGNRKPVTVLHIALADIPRGSAPRRLDTLHSLMQVLYGLAQREVSRYGGTIQHVAGDHIMAVFGVPTVQEDHARRAVLAAFGLRLQATAHAGAADLDVPLRIRMGLHTGQVAVGGIGSAQESVPTVVGDTALFAAEIQEHAPPGVIVCSDATARLVAGYCTLRPLQALLLQDHSTSLPIWEVFTVRETRTRLEVEVERGLTPFVGRERELALLLDRFAQAKAGYGQVIFVVGEAGIGKSRLLFELRRQLGEEATWLEGHAVSFGQAIALHPMVDLLKRHFQIEESDSESTVISKIEAEVLRLGDTLHPLLPYLRYLLSMEPGDPTVSTMHPKLRRAEVYEALRCLLLRAAELRPQILVFEDLHWIDQETEELLRAMFDSIPSSRVLWLFTNRPGYTHPFGDRTYLTRITLPSLSTTDSIQMAQRLLASDSLPIELKALIVQKADGNPFFVEEMLKALQESGAIRHDGEQYVLTRPLAEMTVPDTIQDVLMARIDRLPEPPKQMLQLAAVIGREFTYRLLGCLTDVPEHTENLLQALQAIELIYEKRLFPERVYLFKHALTQEVAYNSMLAPRRRALHRRIGQVIEELYAERLSEHYDMLAYHFARGEAWPQAFDYLCKAAAKAAQAFAIREALALYDHALEVAGHVGELVDRGLLMDIHQAKANLYYVLSDFERSRLEAEYLLTLARDAGDQVREGTALASSAWSSTWARDLDRAIVSAQQALDVAKPIGAASVLARGHFTIGFVRAVTGQHEQAEAEIAHAMRYSQAAGDMVARSLALSTAGLLKNWTADYTAAVALQAEGLALAREHQLLIPLLFGFFLYGITLTGQGDYDKALALFQEGLALAEKVGDEAIHHRLLNCLGWLYSETGNLDAALDLNRQSAEIGQRRRDPGTRPNAELNLGEIFLAQGDLTLAHEFLASIYRYTLDPTTSAWMKYRFSIRLYADLGTFWLRRGELDKATAFADQSLDLATRSTARKNLVKGWRLKGEIALARRAWKEAEAWLQRAVTLAQSVGNPPQLWLTYVVLGQLHTALRRPEGAQQAQQAACDVIDHIKARVQTPELRTSLDRLWITFLGTSI